MNANTSETNHKTMENIREMVSSISSLGSLSAMLSSLASEHTCETRCRQLCTRHKDGEQYEKTMTHFFSFYIFFSVLAHLFFGAECAHDAIAPGDIMIGGLFPIHESVMVTYNADGSDNRTCDR